jgi:hypothetical protein
MEKQYRRAIKGPTEAAMIVPKLFDIAAVEVVDIGHEGSLFVRSDQSS